MVDAEYRLESGMDKNIDFDKKINQYILEVCIHCGKIIRTKDKKKLILFMLDHYGSDDVRLCKDKFYGKFTFNLVNWKSRNY